ncbi:class I SAM-dependent methyltransferase [Streptomyces sp. NRRL F-5123]|uniref:class I SAM-dependent methyltransferase n=1 Tax=Streptomyces sp. NRRL F-5123 TaxID=1463856 RepID=UPI0004E0E97C|nr:class I SAM-dependent methyltransferase [Streptomyces sp. NRRL F-5123]
MDAADFYTGLVADLYAPLKSFSQNPEPYAAFVTESGLPALELGCGDGEPLLELRRRGLDVDGVDSSGDMLDRLRSAAAREGLAVSVFQQRMEELSLPRRYRSVFLAGPTFTLLPTDALALAALRAVRAHLAPGGSALVPLFTPGPTPAADIGRVRSTAGPDGAELRFRVVSEQRDEGARTQTTLLRYERLLGAETEVLERPWVMHWYPRRIFTDLAAAAALTVVSVTDPHGGAVPEDATDVHVRLRAAD